VRCAKCGSDNRDGRKFCGECGAPLNARCASCGAENEPTEKFCGDCGVALAGQVQAVSAKAQAIKPPSPEIRVTPEQPDAQTALEGERKTVTALFADIKGSTELMEDLDPEEARSIIDPALKLMIEAVRRYDGYVVQSTGDGIFALFGAPVAHEDHPQRALHAALATRDELRRRGEELQMRGRAGVEVRIGINTGEVVMRSVQTGGHTEYSPIGTGRRLLRAARSGTNRAKRHRRTDRRLRSRRNRSVARPFRSRRAARADEVRRARA
jgi:class 3 adenylate cyclase